MAFVLKNFSGFFIQLYPAVLLGISVFQDKDWKKGRGRSLAIVTGITLCMALGLPAALRLVHRDTSADYSTLVGNVYMFTAAVILVSISFRLARAHWCTKVIALCISSIYAIAQYLFVNIGLLLAQKGAIDSHQDRLYRPESIILFAATALILSPIFWIFLQKWVRGNVTLLRERQFRYQIRYVVGTTVAYIFVCVIIFSTTEIFPDNIKTVGWAWFLLAVSIIITLSFFFMYWLLFREAFRAEWENRIKEEMRIQQLQYEKICGGDYSCIYFCMCDYLQHDGNISGQYQDGRMGLVSAGCKYNYYALLFLYVLAAVQRSIPGRVGKQDKRRNENTAASV